MRLPRFLQRHRKQAPITILPSSPPPKYNPHELEHLVPLSMTEGERVALGTRCRDADPVPKIDGAGRVFLDPDGRRIQLMHNGIQVLADGYYGAPG